MQMKDTLWTLLLWRSEVRLVMLRNWYFIQKQGAMRAFRREPCDQRGTLENQPKAGRTRDGEASHCNSQGEI